MKDPTKTKTPAPTGATEIVKPGVNEDTAFSRFDMLDLQEIALAQVGKRTKRMIYTWPNRDSSTGKKTCEYEDCKLNGNEKHIHIFGVGINGINYLLSKLWGISVQVGKPFSARKGGQLYYECEAWAYDKFTGNDRNAHILIPESKIKHMPVQHRYSTAQSFAERNAVKKLIDPSYIFELEEIGRQGRDEIMEADVERIFGPMLLERKALQQMHIRAIANGIAIKAPQRPEMAHQANPALPAGETAQETTSAPESETGGFPGSSKQKYGLCSMIVKGTDLTKDQALEFIAERIEKYETVQEYYDVFKGGNFDDVTAWINQPKGNEDES